MQRWLLEHGSLLKRKGYTFYRGMHIRQNHVELYLAAMRYDRDSFAKQSLPGITYDESYTSMVTRRLQTYISKCPTESMILSTEGLSLLRHDDEVNKLSKILGSNYDNIKIIIFLRNSKDYLDSYRLQLKKIKGRKPSTDYWSALYVEDDTWLTNYQQLIKVYSDTFGPDNICIIDYDNDMALKSNILHSFLNAIGLEYSARDEESFKYYNDNATLCSKKSYKHTAFKQLLQKIIQTLYKNIN